MAWQQRVLACLRRCLPDSLVTFRADPAVGRRRRGRQSIGRGLVHRTAQGCRALFCGEEPFSNPEDTGGERCERKRRSACDRRVDPVAHSCMVGQRRSGRIPAQCRRKSNAYRLVRPDTIQSKATSFLRYNTAFFVCEVNAHAHAHPYGLNRVWRCFLTRR